MLDGYQDIRLQRSRGEALVAFDHRGGKTRLVTLRQSGSAKAMFPRVGGPVAEVVFLNTSGGLTGGDRLVYGLDLGQSAAVCATTQTAERGYSSLGAPADVRVTATLGAAARLDWMPQETLLYEDSNLARSTVFDLDPSASCLMSETIVLGRHAMGEHPKRALLRDHRMVRRAGRPVWAETLVLDAQILASLSPAVLGGARAMTVTALIAAGAADAVSAVRAVLQDADCQSAVSGWDGKCVVRLLAPDGWPLKRQLARVLAVLTGRPLPRVWQFGG